MCGTSAKASDRAGVCNALPGTVVEAGMIVVPQMSLDRHMNSQEWRDTDQLQLEGFTIIWHHVQHRSRGRKGQFPCCTVLCSNIYDLTSHSAVSNHFNKTQQEQN